MLCTKNFFFFLNSILAAVHFGVKMYIRKYFDSYMYMEYFNLLSKKSSKYVPV